MLQDGRYFFLLVRAEAVPVGAAVHFAPAAAEYEIRARVGGAGTDSAPHYCPVAAGFAEVARGSSDQFIPSPPPWSRHSC